MQARGIVHLHALIRLDALDPDLADGTEEGTAREVPGLPPASAGLPQLRHALEAAFTATTYRTPPHPQRPDGWLVAWGEQVDIRPVRDPDITDPRKGAMTEDQVAAYLAKYATKATEATGHTSTRLNQATRNEIVARRDHVAHLVDACWELGHPDADTYASVVTGKNVPSRLRYERLRRWAHMLGFGGHFSTKSRRYSTTLGALRAARIQWRHNAIARQHHLDTETDETTLLIGTLTYAGTGWHTTGDALLANTAAAKAREHRRTAREELAQQIAA